MLKYDLIYAFYFLLINFASALVQDTEDIET